jgi:SWIB/MDM2 domain
MVSQLDEPGTPQRKYGSFYTCSNIPNSSECFQNLVGYTSVLRAATNIFHPVGNILGIKEESRAGVIQALWAYIKANNLQDKVDRKRIHADTMLRPVRVNFLVDGTLIRIPSVDIWLRNDPIQSLARAGQSSSRAPKSSGHLLHSKPDRTTTGTASSLGYRA